MLRRLLNFCCNRNNKTYYSVALKKPDGIEYKCYNNQNNNSYFETKDNINEWILLELSKNKWKYQLLYNDEIPEIYNSLENISFQFLNKKGHCKGILLWNDKKIGWLIHSVPKFPDKIDLENKFNIEKIHENQLIYGQSFIYIELEIEDLEDILRQISIMQSNIYYTNYSYFNNYNDYNKKSKQTINDLWLDDNIYHVAKNSKWNKDLYNDFLTHYINSKILCESWMKPGLNSTENAKNIKTLKWDDNFYYKTTQDHSKYAVTMDIKKPWIFIGDINRMESQYRRGGGGLIIKDKNLWKAFNRIIIDYNELVINPNFL